MTEGWKQKTLYILTSVAVKGFGKYFLQYKTSEKFDFNPLILIVMALENLISVQFTQQELNQMDAALATIENILNGKVINLKPEERSRFARIGNETANWIDKVKGYMNQQAALVPFWVNKAEFDRDHDARSNIQPRLNRLKSILESLEDTNILLSSDVYQAAIAFYRNVKQAAQQNVPGTTTIYQDLAAQFPGMPRSVATGPDANSPVGG